MEYIDKRACSEVIEILNHTDKSITKKIPQKFVDFLFNNSDKKYIPNIDFSNNNWEDTIQEDSKAMLALLYRDYIVTEEEKKELIKKEEEEKKINAFGKQEFSEKLVDNNIQLVKSEPWYRKIFKNILGIFGKKK